MTKPKIGSRPEGYVDVLTPKSVSGWVFDAAFPFVSLAVSVQINGKTVAQQPASGFRRDLAVAKKGEGHHAFDIKLPVEFDPARDELKCVVEALGFTIPMGQQALNIIRLARPVAAQAKDKAAPAPKRKKSSKGIASPVFILGSPRSGTSIMASALRAAGYNGFNEGHLLNLMAPVTHVVMGHFQAHKANVDGQLLSMIDAEEFLDSILAVFRTHQDGLNLKEPWFDKTPDAAAIMAAPLIARLWPDTAFIFAKRRAIENITSRLKKFPGSSFESHCLSWAESMMAWRRVRGTGIRQIEIDQIDIVRTPDAIAKTLADFLDMPADALAKVADAFRNERPQQTDDTSTERTLSLKETGWNKEQLEIFRRVCGPELDAHGYSLDKNYWK